MRTITTHRSGHEKDVSGAIEIFATESAGSVVYSFHRPRELSNHVRFIPLMLNGLYFPQAQPDGKLVVGVTVESLIAIVIDRLEQQLEPPFDDQGMSDCRWGDLHNAYGFVSRAMDCLKRVNALRGAEGKPEA